MNQENNKDYNFTEDQKLFFEAFKKMLITGLTPVVQNLVEYIRKLEKEEVGKGTSEIDKLLLLKDINEPMAEILRESIKDLETDYKVSLDAEKYFKNPNLN